MPKASVAVAIIARNSEKTIGACLQSLVPHVAQVVVCVDETTTDQTAKVARRNGAKVYSGLKVSEWHECPQHGRVLAQHFAKARQASFDKLRKDVDWWMWVDADDVVKGADKLHALLAPLSPDIAGVWLPYHYAQAGEDGPTSTLFDRERILRANMPWQWVHRVHEVIVPVGRSTESLNWVRTDEVAICHQGQGHDTAGSARRNLLLCEIDLEENPQDMRALFYIGNQYFALSEWAAAAHYYELSMGTDNVYQRWQTAIYLSMSYERLGNVQAMMHWAHVAIDIVPYHPEPYYRLATAGMMGGDVQRCEFWTKLGDQMGDSPFFAFKNPLDKPFNARVTLAQAYGNAGMISRAKTELQRAAAVIPNVPVVQEGIAQYERAEQETLVANAYGQVLSGMDDAQKLTLPIPIDVWKYGRVRDVVVPAIMRQRPHTQPRMVVWCGQSSEPWAPPSIDTTGIGGSETAVIQIAKRFVADGWRVDVYNEPDRLEGVHDGVGYWGINRLAANEKAEVMVAWRNPQAYSLPIERRVSLLWCHDLNYGDGAGPAMAEWGRVLGVSAWHRDYLSLVYGVEQVDFVPNGIELARFAGGVKKEPWRCVYGSSPDRGLQTLLRLWPQLLLVEPKAELHVAYGWENIDRLIQMGHGQMAAFKAETMRLLEKVPRVVWRGRLPQSELARLYQESYCWLYPTSFLEVSCISAMEAMAAGCVPVTSAAGALVETIGDAGLVVDGNTYSSAWREFWVHCAKAALLVPDVRVPLAQKGIERAKGLTWDASYEKWKELVVPMLEGQKEMVAT